MGPGMQGAGEIVKEDESRRSAALIFVV